MPKLLRSSETFGCGATIELDSKEVVYVSIAQTGVLVRLWNRTGGLVRSIISNFFGPKLYNEKDVYRNAKVAQVLSERFPEQASCLSFRNPVLSVFSNAIWHCSSASEVCVVLNEALNTIPSIDIGSAPKNEDGAIPERSIRIHAADSMEAIPKEYAILTKMFGQRDRDWKLVHRSLLQSPDGRKLDKFILSVSGKREEVFFDITEALAANESREVKARLSSIITRHETDLSVLLPKNEFMMLEIGISQLTQAQLHQIGLSTIDRKSMLDPFVGALKPWFGHEYTAIPEHLSVSMPMSIWSNVMGLLRSWQPADLLQEEELEDLKAIIGGAMDAVRQNRLSSGG